MVAEKVVRMLRDGYTRPACFNSDEEYLLWIDACRDPKSMMKADYCTDCTPVMQRNMLIARRCAHREVRFFWRTLPGSVLDDSRYQIYELIGIKPRKNRTPSRYLEAGPHEEGPYVLIKK